MFLWQWSRRRRVGLATVALRGALIGAAGGLLFALILGAGFDSGGARDTAWFLQSLRDFGVLLGLSIPSFAWIGYSGATRVFEGHEQIFQALLRQGAVVPEQPPVLRLADRGPAIAVALTAIGIAVFIVVLFVMYG
jgi:hypothetical protein